MPWTKPFASLTKGDAAIAGGKGASLGEMTQAGIPVPPGYVVLSTTFDQFLNDTDLVQEIDAILEKVDHQAIHTVDAASEQIRGLIESKEIPQAIREEITKEFKKLDAEFVAVRSSATAEDGADHAWAGQLDTYLNTTAENVLANVRRCWASLFTPRAIFYRFEKGLHNTHISVAVVVQKMVQSEKSGIAFSVHPVTEDYNQLIIEAGLGLGEAIVSGAVTPDSYVVEKNPRNILDINVNEQTRALYKASTGGNEWKDLDSVTAASQVLNKEEILELADLVLKIESHYGFPCDIEWAFEAGKFYITQSRPITTLSKNGEKKRVFTKTLERDTTLLMQGLFSQALTQDLSKEYGITVIHPPFCFHVANTTHIIFYEDLENQKEFLTALEVAFQKNDDLIRKIEKDYTRELDILKSFWSKGKAADLGEFKKYLEHARKAILPLALCFYSGGITNLPKHVADMVVHLRKVEDLFANGDEYVRDSLENFGVGRSFSHLVVLEEIDYLPTNDELQKRKETGVVLEDGRARFFTKGETIQAIFPQFTFDSPQVTEQKSSFEGQVGYAGLVSGPVFVVRNREDAARVPEGAILVASMTTPDFLPAMHKAAAFVTDEGGITCHAAIVARELKKPCIIGTKFATQLLKDGDLVEVDAEKGIVRILKK